MTTSRNATSQQDQAYEIILDHIVHLDYPPGAKLLIKTLCDELGLGRTPVRESLVRLSQQGLVYTVPQSGTFISRINMASAENARFIREHLERKVALECCSRIDATGLGMLASCISDQVGAASARDRRRFFDGDNRFHKTIFELAGRTEVWQWLQQTNAHLERYRWLRVLVEDLPWQSIVQHHSKLYNAFEARATDEVDFLVAAHLHMMLEEQRAVIHRFPDYFVEAKPL